MQQQVNLFQFVERPKEKFLEINTILRIYGILFAALFALTILQWAIVHHTKTKVAFLKNQTEQERQIFISEANKFPGISQVIKKVDANKLTECQTKFSKYLTAFAESIVPGVWLTNIQVSENGKQILLKGLGYKPDQIEMYLANLKETALFHNFEFELQNITQSEPNEMESSQIKESKFGVTTTATSNEKTKPNTLNFAITAKSNTNG